MTEIEEPTYYDVNYRLFQRLENTQEKYAKVVGMLVISVIINIAFVLEIII